MKLKNKFSAMLCIVFLAVSLFQTTGCKLASEDICREDEKSTRSDCTELRDVNPPVINLGIEIASVTSSSIVLSWGAASDDVTSTAQLRYKLVVANEADVVNSIEKAVKLPSSAVLLDSVEGQTSFEYSGLPPATQYAFAVVVSDLEGNSSFYQPVIQATWDPNIKKPESFSLTAAQAGDGEATLSWNTAPGATSYIIRRGTTSGLYSTVARTESSPFTDKELSNGTTYYYMITAENAGGWTDATAELTVTPISTDRTKPSLLSLSPASGTFSSLPTQIVASFSEAMSPLKAESLVLATTGCSVPPAVTGISASDDAKTWTATLSTATCSNAAQLSVTMTPSSLSDLAGNSGDGSAVTNTYTYNAPNPSITFATPSSQYIRNGLSVTIDSSFFDAISTTLSNGTSGVALQSTGSASCSASLSSVTTSGARVTISSCTGDGTVKARLAAGVVSGANGSSNTEAVDSSTVTVDNTAPTLSSLTPTTSATLPTTVVATFSEAISNVSTSTFAISVQSGCTPQAAVVTGVSGSTDAKVWTASLTLNDCDDGALDSFKITVDPLTVTDRAGNAGQGCPLEETYGSPCFVGLTMITTPTGLRPLQDLRPGDSVISHNFTEGRDELAVIRELTVTNVNDVTTLVHSDERILIGASRHRLLNRSGSPTMLRHALSEGFRTVDTRLLKAPVLMYDLILDKNHNFYANNFLVESIKPSSKPLKNKAIQNAPNFCLARR